MDESIETKIMDAVNHVPIKKQICPRVNFLDFGGQSMYYAFHQIFFSPETCYILVVDMTKKLDEKVTKTDDEGCSLFKSWTYEGMKKVLCFRLVNNIISKD